VFGRICIRLSSDDTRRLMEILYPRESDPLGHTWESLRRRHRIARVVVLLVLLAAAADVPYAWSLLAGLLNH